MNTVTHDFEDLEQLAASGKRPHGPCVRILIDRERHIVKEPTVTGRQLLQLAAKQPVEEHLVYFVAPTGILEDINLEETVDLRKRSVERFLTFRSDRSFRFELDGNRQDWGAPTITGHTLLILARKNPKQFGVWRILDGSDDVRIGTRDFADLSEPGLERFRTAYVLCIEGRELPWEQPTITTEQIAELGGWSIDQGVIEIDPHQNERTLAPGEVIELKDGNRFGKKFRWKRGLHDNPRISDELNLLKKHYQHVECLQVEGSYWFRIEPFDVPENCLPRRTILVYSVTIGHPGLPPYGFYIPAEVTRDGTVVSDKSPPAAPPFEGEWRFVSHQPNSWHPAADVNNGDNLWGWARSIRDRIGTAG